LRSFQPRGNFGELSAAITASKQGGLLMNLSEIIEGLNYAFYAARDTNIEFLITALTTVAVGIASLFKFRFIRNTRNNIMIKILINIVIYTIAFLLLLFFMRQAMEARILLALLVPMPISIFDLIITYQRTVEEYEKDSVETKKNKIALFLQIPLMMILKTALVLLFVFIVVVVQTVLIYWPREIEYYWTRFPAPIEEIFPDPVLARYIASSLGRGNRTDINIAQEDLENITSFTVMYAFPDRHVTKAPFTEGSLRGGVGEIQDLEGMQYLTSLRYLAIVGHGGLTDISPLSELFDLTQLMLTGNRISDLTPLENLTNLEWLNLTHNRIYDISPLTKLSRLDYLALGNHAHEFYVLGGTASNRISLEPIINQNPLILESIVININGDSISPSRVSGGTYDTPYLIWIDLSENHTSVIYEFSAEVSVGNATTIFSGRVSQPLLPPQ